ncbi:MAG: hypothetical protein FJ029_13645 [Actinobacteria bacterium]|nr:hypothetical protein [Actinomycetota bacterium]
MKKFGRPSPAMVLAVIALIAALGGTAIAGGALTSKKAKKIANKQITKRAPGLEVAKAGTANTATTAGSADNVFFATVDYNDSTPAILSGTPGIVGNGELFLGAPRLTFPRDMTGCAVTVNLFNGGTAGMARQSTTSAGADVLTPMVNAAGTDIRSDYNIVAVCP